MCVSCINLNLLTMKLMMMIYKNSNSSNNSNNVITTAMGRLKWVSREHS